MKDSKVLPNGLSPSEYTRQPLFLCHCDSVLSLEGDKAAEIKPSHDHSFPKELFKQRGGTLVEAYVTISIHYQQTLYTFKEDRVTNMGHCLQIKYHI